MDYLTGFVVFLALWIILPTQSYNMFSQLSRAMIFQT